MYIEGKIHYARGCGVAACHLAKLLRHHRLRCGGADWIDVRGDRLDHGDSGAKVEWDAGGIRHTKRRAFWRRAAGRRDSERAVAGALECWPAARPLRFRRGDVRRHRGTAGAPSEGLSTGTGRLAVAYGLSAHFLHSTRRRGDCAPGQSGAGTVRHRCRYASAPVHRHPQRVGYRYLPCRRALGAREQELESPGWRACPGRVAGRRRGEELCPGSLSSARESRDSTQLLPCRTPVSRAASTKRPTASAVACTPIAPPGPTGWSASGAGNSSTATMRPSTSSSSASASTPSTWSGQEQSRHKTSCISAIAFTARKNWPGTSRRSLRSWGSRCRRLVSPRPTPTLPRRASGSTI